MRHTRRRTLFLPHRVCKAHHEKNPAPPTSHPVSLHLSALGWSFKCLSFLLLLQKQSKERRASHGSQFEGPSPLWWEGVAAEARDRRPHHVCSQEVEMMSVLSFSRGDRRMSTSCLQSGSREVMSVLSLPLPLPSPQNPKPMTRHPRS